ncbi:hypothetical protein RIF29_05118 [Crotalaria pallida]|uniref:Uncharacterized protein n=1 Tax=Crotalaria pallida TaxID=3830 RepID=A0AAN9J2R9_CROPI
MVVHSSPVAKRLWNVLRIAFFMMRKGLSKRKMMMDMNLMMKKGKVLRKSLSNLIHHNHHHLHSKSMSRGVSRGSFGVQDYEFSCSNSPNPVFFHMPKRKHHFNFPCIHAPEVCEEELIDLSSLEGDKPKSMDLAPKTPEYTFNFTFDASDYGPGEKKSPLLSPFSVRVSNYSALDENEDFGNCQVDDEAEDFIKRFYEQLRKQNPNQLLKYQDM